VGKRDENRPLLSHGGGSQITAGSGLSNFEFRLAAEQARERPGLAWSMCKLEQAVAFCLEQEGFLSGFQVVESQFHPVHFAPLSRLERVSPGCEISMDFGRHQCVW
jgi:ribosomal protein S8